MKMKTERYELLKSGFAALVAHYCYTGHTFSMGDLWNVYHHVVRQFLYDDSHPGFAKHHWQRLLPFMPNYNQYEGGLNDNHLETAIRRIAKDLKLKTV